VADVLLSVSSHYVGATPESVGRSNGKQLSQRIISSLNGK